MNGYSKVCDAADWFRPEIDTIIRNELRETPRFHRKQWEAAMIFHVLRDCGKLQSNALGLSMGGGKELIAYAVAQHVSQLTITDLYELNTSWDCAKTTEPNEYIRANKPFPVDDAKLNALRMDMRQLNFPEKKFDFAYSCCAVEHIGGREDFLRHFNEVARVLNDDGVYVFTTEILYGNDTIPDDHNYVFSLPDLDSIITQSDLVAESDFNARISQHKINYALPSTLKQLSYFVPESLTDAIMQEAPHIQLLRGRHPFTCGVFILRKRTAETRSRRMRFVGLEQTRSFAEEGVAEYRAMLENTRVSVNPFSMLPSAKSRFCADHEEFFSTNNRGDDETPFHTDYFWWGKGKRVFDIALRVDDASHQGAPEIEIRVHRFRTLASREVECVSATTRPVQRAGWMVRTIEVDVEDDSCYAVLGKVHNGACRFGKIEIKSYPPRLSRSYQREGAKIVRVNRKAA